MTTGVLKPFRYYFIIQIENITGVIKLFSMVFQCLYFIILTNLQILDSF